MTEAALQVTLTREQLDQLAVAVAELVASRLDPPASRWLTLPEAAQRVRLSIDGMHRLTGSGAVPHVKQGGRCLFDEAELDQWLEDHRVGPPHVSTGFPGARKAA